MSTIAQRFQRILRQTADCPRCGAVDDEPCLTWRGETFLDGTQHPERNCCGCKHRVIRDESGESVAYELDFCNEHREALLTSLREAGDAEIAELNSVSARFAEKCLTQQLGECNG